MTAPMSAEEIQFCMHDAVVQLDADTAERLNLATIAVSAMAEREAALVAERDALRKMWAQAESDIAALVREVEALRATLERIATQGPNYGHDGTRETWKHWADIAQEAIDAARAEARDG